MNHCLIIYFKFVHRKRRLMANLTKYNFCPIRRKEHNCIFLAAKGNVTKAEWSACAPTAHVVFHSCRSLRNTALHADVS
jgi:hypothetical protein